jgi:hypothetical protein
LTVALAPKGATSMQLFAVQARRVNSREADGSFGFRGVLAGSYVLTVTAQDAQGAPLVASVPLQVGERHIEGLVLQPAPLLELAGSVAVAEKTPVPPGAVRVALDPSRFLGLAPSFATANEEGKFAQKSLAPNQYRVQVTNLPEGWYVKSVRYGSQEVGEDGVDLTGGASGGLQITLSTAGAETEGTVRDDDGKPVSGATVALVPDSRRPSLFKETRTADDGGYSIKGIAPGDYEILAWEDIEPGAYEDPEFLKPFESKAEKLSLKEGSHIGTPLKAIPAHE